MRVLMIAVLIAGLSANTFAGQGFFGFGGTAPSAVEGFNFGYQINDGKAVGLIQAFDDGKRVYFQFRDLDLKQAPQVWSIDSAGNRHAVAVDATTPYIVSESIERKFVFVFGKGKDVKEATVLRLSAEIPVGHVSAKLERRLSPGNDPTSPTADSSQQMGEVRPCETDSLPSPSPRVANVPFAIRAESPTRKAQEDIKAIARKIQQSGREVVVRGRPSNADNLALARSRAESIRALLIQAGVSPTKITVTTDARPKPDGAVFYSEIFLAGPPSSGFVLLDGC